MDDENKVVDDEEAEPLPPDWTNEADKPEDWKEPFKGGRAFIGTWNNYTEEDYQFMISYPCRYKIIAKEVGKKGTPHLQFVLYFTHQVTLKCLAKKLKSKTHLEYCFDVFRCIKYCKKEGNFFVAGDPPKKVSVNLWPRIKDQIKLGIPWIELIENYPEYAVKYYNSLRNYYEELRPKYQFNLIEKYGSYLPWQDSLLSDLRAPPPDRKVVWIVDEAGGRGKTDLATHLVSTCGWLRLTNGKTADLAHAWNGQHVVFDYSRSQADHINYGIIEDIKNGQVFSSKYQSCSKLYARPWVIVLSNFPPDESKLSADRWDIRYI